MKTKICTLIACIAVGSIFMTQPAMGGEVIPLTKYVSVRTGEASANARNTTVTSELAPVQQKVSIARAMPEGAVFYEDFENGLGGWLIQDNAVDLSKIMQIKEGLSISGSHYFWSGWNTSAARNAWALSPAVALTAGITYYVSFYVYAPGFDNKLDEYKLTVGNAQTVASQTGVLIDKTGSNAKATNNWELVSTTFTPFVSATYYFGINHCTQAVNVNSVYFDDFSVSTVEPRKPKPILGDIQFLCGAAWEWNTGANDLWLQQESDFAGYISYNYGTFIDSVFWSCDQGVVPEWNNSWYTSFSYPGEGIYTISAKAMNESGDTTVTRSLNVHYPKEGDKVIISHKAPHETVNYYRYYTDGSGDVFGINNNYRSIAEWYILQEDAEASVDSVKLVLGKYKMEKTHADKPLLIRIVKSSSADSLGYATDSIEFGRYTTTFAKVFGYDSLESEEVVIRFPEPIRVKGEFFIALDFPTGNDTIPYSENNQFFVQYIQHNNSGCSNETSTYIKLPNGKWYNLSTWRENRWSSCILPYLTYGKGFINELQTVNAGSISVYPNPAQNCLYVQGISAACTITITDITGKVLAVQHGYTPEQGISIQNLTRGLYLLTIQNENRIHAIKFVKE